MNTRQALLTLALLGLATPLAAQQPTRPAARPAPATAAAATTPTKIAYLNSRAIMAQTPGYAAAESTFARELEASRGEVARMQAALDSAATDFETSSVLLSPTAKQARQQQLIAQQNALQTRQQQLQGQMEARQQQLIDPIQQRVQAVIEGVRAELNLAIVFDVAAMGGAMVSADRSLDISGIIIQRLQPAPGR
jgi:outer membrane protein